MTQKKKNTPLKIGLQKKKERLGLKKKRLTLERERERERESLVRQLLNYGKV